MALRFMNDTRKPRHVISGKLGYHQNIHYKLGKKVCSGSLTTTLLKYVELLNTLLVDFASGRGVSLSRSELENLSAILVRTSTSSSSEKLIKENLLNILYGIQAGNLIISEKAEIENKYELAKTDSDILNDKEKLRDYLERIRKSFIPYIFDFGTTYAPQLHLKPKYQLYIDRHGIPENGVWNPALLGAIVNELEFAKQLENNEIL